MTKHLLRACRGCGCTGDRACPGGCYWVEPDLCSSCAGPLVIVTYDAAPRRVIVERSPTTRLAPPRRPFRRIFPRTAVGVRQACAMLARDNAGFTGLLDL